MKNILKGVVVVNEEGFGKSLVMIGVFGKVVVENVVIGKKKVGMIVGGGFLVNLWGRVFVKVKVDIL